MRAQYDPVKDVGGRIAEYALKSVGTPCDKTHPQVSKFRPGLEWVATSDNLAETSSIALANRCIAMASATNWKEYYALLLNLNFRDGVLNLANQNHFLILDWPKTAAWAVADVTTELGAPTCKGVYKYDYHEYDDPGHSACDPASNTVPKWSKLTCGRSGCLERSVFGYGMIRLRYPAWMIQAGLNSAEINTLTIEA